MEKKKRNIVLEIFICTAIAAAVLVGYLTFAGDKGVFEIQDLEGERSELAAFSFEGTAGDDVHQIHYRWENGELTRKTYPCNEQTVFNLINARRKGVNPLKKYFYTEFGTAQYRHERVLQTAPAEGAGMEPLQNWADVPPEIMEDYFKMRVYEENPYGNDAFRVRGTKAEAASFFINLEYMKEISHYGGSYTIGVPQGYSRAFTGLTLSDGPYYYLTWEEKGEDTYSDIYDDNIGYKGAGFDFLTADTENAIYGILSANHNVTGEVFLLRFPKEKMTRQDMALLLEGDAPYSREVYGEAETIAVFDVNEGSGILALAACGEDMLLLARTEGGALYLELYDSEGTLIDRENTGIEGILHWEDAQFEGLCRKGSAVLGITVTTKENPEDDESIRYGKISDKYFITREGLLRLDGTAYANYTDYKDGKTLLINAVQENETLAMRYTYRDKRTQLSFTVKDEETEQTLYRGILKTDFSQDFNKELAQINISKLADTLEEQKQDPATIVGEYSRNVGWRILPLDDVSATDEALSGGQYYSTWEYNEYFF